MNATSTRQAASCSCRRGWDNGCYGTPRGEQGQRQPIGIGLVGRVPAAAERLSAEELRIVWWRFAGRPRLPCSTMPRRCSQPGAFRIPLTFSLSTSVFAGSRTAEDIVRLARMLDELEPRSWGRPRHRCSRLVRERTDARERATIF